MWSSGSAGSASPTFTRSTRSMPKRKRQSSAVASGDVACASTTRTSPFGVSFSHFDAMRYMAKPAGSPSSSSSAKYFGPAPSRQCSGSASAVLTPPILAAAEVSRAGGSKPLVDRREQLEGLVRGDQPHRAARPGIVPQREGGSVRVELRPEDGHPVPEAAVDQRLGGVKDRERLAAGVDVVELSEHELPQDPAPPVARENPDPAHARRLSGAPGSRQLERIRPGHADRATVVPGGEHPVAGHHLAVTLDVVVLQLLAEGRVRREQNRGELVLGGASVLDAHRLEQATRSARAARTRP